jgi:hypothetical protein
MGTIKRIFGQTMRGCGYLPHVGEHPGTLWMIMFILFGGMAGVSRGGMYGMIGGLMFMALFVLPLYLWGAYDRANLSDNITKNEEEKP